MTEREIFTAALTKEDPAERAAFLEEACAGDAPLRQRVASLLAEHQQLGSFLDVPSPAATLDPPPLERPGTQIGPYKLLQQIGGGGMGTVFMAEQTQPVQRKVALKVIKPGMDSGQVIARFEVERQALAMMDHVNIARVLDAGATESGRPYFVMELVHGVPITKYCDENHLTPRERLELFVPVCQAVQHAHQKGIIHRDIKPSNVMVTLYDGKPVPKVIDFGVAKATEQKLTERTLFTQYGTMVGTLEYMSPEQAEMSALGADTRSDIFSLGVLLYELLTGSTPLSRKRLKEAAYGEILRMIKEEEPPKPSTRLSDSGEALASISAQRRMEPAKLSKLMRGELDWIVMKTLEKDRNRRYETANAVAEDVLHYLADEPVHACPPSAAYRLRKLVRRNKGPVLAASLLLLALLGGIIGTTLGMIRATGAQAEAVNEAEQKEHALTEKETALSTARQSERDAKDQLFLALLNQARAGRFSRQMGQRMDSLDALAKAAAIRPDERLRDEAIAAMALPDVRRGPSLPGLQGIAFDGAYQSYARINEQGIISIRSIPANEEIRCIETKSKSRPSVLWLSPNGQFLAALDEHHAVQLWRVADGKPLLREEPQPCSSLAFSPDSRQLAVGKDDWVLAIDVASGQQTNRWRLPAKAHSLAFHPNNRRLAVGFANNNVASIYDSPQGSHVADLPVGLMDQEAIAWHPDGARLAVAGSDPRIQIWDVAAKRHLATLEGHVQQVTALSFHPDGSLLASISWDGVLRLWDPATGRQLMQLPLAAAPRFSSTGQWLGHLWQGGERVQLLEVTTSREYRTIVSSLGSLGVGQEPSYHDGDISPDGRLLALGMGSAGDRLWDLSSGRELAVLPSGSKCVLFQSDGRELFTCGDAGLQRWPIQERKEAANELRLGPPRKIALPVVPQRAARSPDGRTLAIVSETSGSGLLMDLKAESVQGQLFAHPRACEVALSRDGRWIASCGWHSDRVRLWNARTGTMAHEWVLGVMTGVFFTPDSRALVICRGDAFSFWDVDTLQPIRRLGRDVALYPGHVAFSPDAQAIHVWDLRAIRQRLKAMGLDWDWPEFRPADPKAKAAEPPKVEVLLGDLAKPALTREAKRLPPPSPEVREAWRREMQRRAKALKLSRMDRDKSVPVELLPAALHRYDDPEHDLHEATLWAWGRAGRPVALAAMEFYSRPEAGAKAVYELVSLADGPIRAAATAGAWHWSPKQPGVVLHEFSGAGAAANTEIERLKQMKDLAKRLTAFEVYGADHERVELRLLPEPVHRYADAGSGLLDGAILVFAHGSNPEIVLLVEARGQGKSGAKWHYGLARLSSGGLSVSLGGRDVWEQSAAPVATSQESYCVVLIKVKGDSNKETNETFYLDLFGNSSNSLFTKNRGIGTILNDDGGSLGSTGISSAWAVDAAIEDFMSAGPKKRGR